MWCLSYLLDHLQCSEGLDDAALLRYRKRCDALYRLLSGNVLLPGEDEVCAFLLDRKGNPKRGGIGGSMYTSMYADCFVIMGIARYALLIKSREIAQEALAIYTKMQRVMAEGIIKTEPYPLPEGACAQAIPMIICNTAHELSLVLGQLGMSQSSYIKKDARSAAHTVLQKFADEQTMQIREVVYKDPQKGMDLLARHRNPGHAIECMWFCLDALGDKTATNFPHMFWHHSNLDGIQSGEVCCVMSMQKEENRKGGVMALLSPTCGINMGYETLVAACGSNLCMRALLSSH